MSAPVVIGGLTVARCLFDFVADEALPNTNLSPADFWAGFEELVTELAPKNRALLDERDRLQTLVNSWHQTNPKHPIDLPSYKEFLTSIGYLVPEPEPFTIETGTVDPELSTIAGPQLVVPVLNARFALNAANARWGSLYDALYGTDAIPRPAGGVPARQYDAERGRQVVRFGRGFLDQCFPLTNAAHARATGYQITNSALVVDLPDGTTALLQRPEQLRGYTGAADAPTSVLLCNHNLHVDIQIDRHHSIGSTDPAGVKDLVIESAVTTIVDFEVWFPPNRGGLLYAASRSGAAVFS